MKSGSIIAGFAVFFLAILVYSQQLREQVLVLESQLDLVKRTEQDLQDTENGLNQDIHRAQKLRSDIEIELQQENEAYQLLAKALEAVQSRLKGSERLEDALARLEIEYGALVEEAKSLQEITR